ncbi:hypothetical protein [Vibrio crassostreae]|uniref:hypothetical protein n=1 Tax=Vibrio crassostreae TaxID=246167 RepID=UPI001B301D2C|nr:hypothetical protein [Vibrio crassostreae]
MSDFTAIGQLVTEARNLLDSIKGGAIRTMQTQFDALLLLYKNRTDKAVTDGLGKINDFLKTAGAGVLPEADFQRLVKTSGKVWGKHYLMGVSPSMYTNPSRPEYKQGQRNGILLWKVGANHDAKQIGYGLGFSGKIVGTRTGILVDETGCEIKVMRHWDRTYNYINDAENSIGLKVGTFDYNGETYQTLISDYSGGGAVLLDGFAALRDCDIKDDNFGRYINDRDGSVFDEFAPIATVQYK